MTEDLESALGGTGWRQPTADLWSCGGTDGSSPGWLRHVTIIDDQGRKEPATAAAAASSVLRRHGYAVSGPQRSDTTVVLGGSRPGGPGSASVQVQVDHGYVSVELTGGCER